MSPSKAIASALLLGFCPFSFGQTICIDPGHPSEVGRGTQSPQITEIRAAWLVAMKLQKLLEKRGYKVVLTKSSEEELVKNQKRAEIANASKADLLVRLHCDASAGSGFTVYFPDRKGTSGTKIGPSEAVIKSSSRLAKIFHASMVKSLKGILATEGLKPDTKTLVGSKQGALTGSIYSEVPVLLVEMCVLTNPKDAAWMASDKGQSQMATALAKPRSPPSQLGTNLRGI